MKVRDPDPSNSAATAGQLLPLPIKPLLALMGSTIAPISGFNTY